MRTIFVLDEKNYTDDMPVFERVGVRAIIRRDGLLAMQQSAAGEYKIPGGGMDKGETIAEALAREVREETGLVVKPETMQELGEIIDMHLCAAIARGVKANRLNGFDYWYVKRDGKLVSISEVRDNYRQSLQ